MPLLADFIGPQGVSRIAQDIRTAFAAFPSRRFIRIACVGIEGLPLFARANHVAKALDDVLRQPFSDVVRILVAASGPPRAAPGYGPLENFRFLAFTRLVSLFGLHRFDDAMWGLKELTRRFTSEFDIRPFLLADETRTLSELESWVDAEDLHIRRLVSEGTRTRLPWATHLRSFQRDPAKLLRLIEGLKTDPERYVQISVANSLADVIKDNREFGLVVAERWNASGHPITRMIVRHAVRLPAKQGCIRSIFLRGEAPNTGADIASR